MIWRKQQPDYNTKLKVSIFSNALISFLSCILTSFEAISFLANSAGDAYAAMVLRLIIGSAERREKATIESMVCKDNVLHK